VAWLRQPGHDVTTQDGEVLALWVVGSERIAVPAELRA